MKKFKIGVCEKIELNHEFNIELPSDVNEEEVWGMIDTAEDRYEVYGIVEKYGGKVKGFTEDGSGGVQIEVEWVD